MARDGQCGAKMGCGNEAEGSEGERGGGGGPGRWGGGKESDTTERLT